VIEAGDLRRNAPLRVLGERSPAIAAIACYVDGDRELTRLIEDEMRSAGLSISADAKSALLPLLGADRRASRNEVRKLALYAHGKSQVDVDDVFAVVADASALALDAVVDAAFAGRAAELETHYAKARDAGIAPTRILSTAQFQVSQLHRARIAADSGTGLAEAAEQIVSRAQFRRKALIETALKSWSAPRLERAMAELANATLETRKLSGPTAELADPVVSRTLLAIATMARQRK
jgi:DNA polymerase-3 subunit delta